MNERIRKAAKDNGVKLYEVAFYYGCNDGNFSRKLRRELPEAEQEKIITIIKTIAEKKEEEG